MYLPLVLGPPTDTGTEILNIQAATLFGGGLPAGQSYLLGTITFHKELTGEDQFSAELFFTTEDSVAGDQEIICDLEFGTDDQCELNGATVNVPEPGIAAMSLTAGLVLFGLYQADGRRRNS